jgi:cytochrome c oxidase assembly factor CtaG
MRRAVQWGMSVVAAVAVLVAGVPSVVLAHGVTPEPSSVLSVGLAWSIEAHILLPLLVAFLLYRRAERQVAREHPANPVPRWRAWSWYGGLLVLLIALQSPIATYDTTLFSVHMAQHLLMAMVAAPMLAMGAPITLLLRVSSPHTRQRVLLPVLHSLPLRIISFPVVTWVFFAAVMWASHFSPLYNLALQSEAWHLAEHALYMSAAMLFWWPVVGADPSPWRLPHAARIGYLFLGMPQSSFLGLAIICTGLAFLIFFALIAEVGPARATVITYINPAVAVTLGVVVLNEVLTATIAAGFVLILAGSILSTVRNRREPAAADPSDEPPGLEEVAEPQR